jgi:hypothetical protein
LMKPSRCCENKRCKARRQPVSPRVGTTVTWNLARRQSRVRLAWGACLRECEMYVYRLEGLTDYSAGRTVNPVA